MLDIDTKRAEKIIGQFIIHHVESAQFQGAVLGLSGGLDSSVVAALASRVLGSERVLGILMPYKFSSSESTEHANLIAKQLGIRTKTFDITKIAEGYETNLDKLRLGNLLARLRMCIVFDQSKAESLIVLGTSNKTEFLLGYTTWYGDMAAGIYPIADFYKTQVRMLAKHLGIPQVIIDKPPTADLWPDQTDESEIGNSYERIDKMLQLLVDGRLSPKETIQKGFSEQEVTRLTKMVIKNQYKRVMPPICKISARTIGYDFNYIKDWSTSL